MREFWQGHPERLTIIAGAGLAIAVLAVLAAMKLAAGVLLPVVFALFLAIALAPVSDRIRARVPEKVSWLGPLAAMMILVAALAALVAILVMAGRQLDGAGVEIPDSMLSQILGVEGAPPQKTGAGGAPQPQSGIGGTSSGEAAGGGQSQPQTAAPVMESADGQPPQGDAQGGSGAAGGTLTDRLMQVAQGYAGEAAALIVKNGIGIVTGVVLTVFFVLVMLLEADRWRAALRSVSGGRMGAVDEAARSFGHQLRVYVMARVVTGAISALLYVGWLAIFGVDLLLVWGVVTFILAFVPTIGSIISGTLATGYAFVTKDWSTALMVAAGLFAIEQAVGNLLDPLIQGRMIGISPVVVLISILVWGYVWGVGGALLAVPVTVLIMNLALRAPGLKGLGLMLSNRRDIGEVEALLDKAAD